MTSEPEKIRKNNRGYTASVEEVKSFGVRELEKKAPKPGSAVKLLRENSWPQSRKYKKSTCYLFTGHFKALVINNLTHYHTMGPNCTDEEGSVLLSWPNYSTFKDESALREEELSRYERRFKSKLRKPQQQKIVPCNKFIPDKGNIPTEVGAIIKKFKHKFPSLDWCPYCVTLLTAV